MPAAEETGGFIIPAVSNRCHKYIFMVLTLQTHIGLQFYVNFTVFARFYLALLYI